MDAEIVSMEGDAGVNSSQNSVENHDEMNDLTEAHNEAHNEDAIDSAHLRQFDVLDEVQGDESGSENDDNEQKGKKRDFRLIFSVEFL